MDPRSCCCRGCVYRLIFTRLARAGRRTRRRHREQGHLGSSYGCNGARPEHVQLKDQAQPALPDGYGFVPPKEGAAVMGMLGNQTDERFVGLIFPKAEDSNWS